MATILPEQIPPNHLLDKFYNISLVIVDLIITNNFQNANHRLIRDLLRPILLLGRLT
jgi:hypothetical protein